MTDTPCWYCQGGPLVAWVETVSRASRPACARCADHVLVCPHSDGQVWAVHLLVETRGKISGSFPQGR